VKRKKEQKTDLRRIIFEFFQEAFITWPFKVK
jgi:hypothetical protein